MGRFQLTDYPAIFVPRDPPRTGHFMFWSPAATMGPADQLTVLSEARLGESTTMIVRWSGGKAKTGHVPYRLAGRLAAAGALPHP